MNGWLIVSAVSFVSTVLLAWIRAARWTADPPYQPRNQGDEE